MSDTKNTNSKTKIICAAVFAALYLLGSAGIFGIAGSPVILLSLPAFLILAGRRGYLLSAFVLIFTAISGYLLGDMHIMLLSLIQVLSYAVCAGIISGCYRAGKNKAYICGLGAFSLTLLSLLSIFADFFIAAKQAGVRFGTFFFDSVEKVINAYISLYENMLANAVNTLPEIYAQKAVIPEINPEALYSSFTLIFTLMPAIMYCVYFALIFLCASLLNTVNRKLSLVPDRKFGKYNVSGVTHGFFSVLGTIFVFTLFFGADLSPFTMGLLSTLIAILPHFIVFAYRRLYRMFARFAGKTGAVILLAIITGVAFFMAPMLALFVLSFIGTYEYRTQNIIRIVK